MEFTAEWKSLWSISSTFKAPLSIRNKGSENPLGPLIFTPVCNSFTTLLDSPSLSPCLPPPYPQFPLSRFLQYSAPSAGTSVPSLLGLQLSDHSSHFHGFNTLQLLQIPSKNLVISFFPTGENSNHVGVSLFSVKDGILTRHSKRENFFQLVKEGNVNHQRITSLLVNMVDNPFGDENEANTSVNKCSNAITVVGFLMACTDYSANWYRVGISMDHRQNECSVSVDYLGGADVKMLRGNAVVGGCWSPHLMEECLVLLQNGDLLLFDVYSSRRKDHFLSLVDRFVRKRMKVSLSDKLDLGNECGEKGVQWFGCEFSWHPRIFITCNRSRVFLVDLRSPGECSVCCLLKIEMLSTCRNDEFCALSRAGSSGFLYCVSTQNLLLLCDVRKPLMPLLQWVHGIHNPRYMTVFGLSDLRANVKNTNYKFASQSGHCIMLGSFWDDEFCLFCYGPDVNKNASVSNEISKFCNTNYAWGHPSEFSLSGSDCKCGSCIVTEEFLKPSLPVWIDWRQKKQLILGFGILHPDLHSRISADSLGGFTIIRLTSAGKLESQYYAAAWETEKFSLTGHKRKVTHLEDNLLYDCMPSQYDGEKKFKHMKLEYLNVYLKDKLAKCIVEKRESKNWRNEGSNKVKHLAKSESEFHQAICCGLKDFGLPEVRSSLTMSDIFKDVSLPTSIHDIASRSMSAALPSNLLRLAFATYVDLANDPNHRKEALEFLGIPNQSQLPPFPSRKPSDRSNKWSGKVQPPHALTGPILPPPFLVTLHKICLEELKTKGNPYMEESEALSAHWLFKQQCDKVMEAVQEHASRSDADADDAFVSLQDDTDELHCASQKSKLSYYKASRFLENLNVGMSKQIHEYSTHVFRRNQELDFSISAETVVPRDLLDAGCPVELKFADCGIDFSRKELQAFRILKKRDLDFMGSFKPYQDFINKGCNPK